MRRACESTPACNHHHLSSRVKPPPPLAIFGRSDVIGEPSVELVRLLLTHGADLQRDDAQELWFTPLHNAVANGAHALVAVMLESMPDAINLTTGDGRAPLHVLSLCDDADDRVATADVLLRPRGSNSGGSGGSNRTPRALLNFHEPFYGNTPLHAHAKDGHSEVAIKLLEAGASHAELNEAGRTPLQEAMEELAALEAEGLAQTAMRRSRLANTISVMEIAVLAY